MDRTQSLTLMKALADDTRLELLRLLAERPGYGEELAAQLKLTASTVSFHLTKLEQAGLVRRTKEQYYAVYSLNEELLDTPVRAFISAAGAPTRMHDARLEAYQKKVLSTFFRHTKLRQLPTQKKKRLIVLEHFARKFAAGRVYAEQDVNAIITECYEDYCTIRRELIDAGYLSRDGQRYKRTAMPAPGGAHITTVQEEPMGSLKELKMRYKLTPTIAGVYQIKNTVTGKILLGSSLNLHGPWNRHSFALKMGGHQNKTLQADWNTYGADAFIFEILETVKEDPDVHPSDALKVLEDKWTRALDPYGVNGYNAGNVVKRIREA